MLLNNFKVCSLKQIFRPSQTDFFTFLENGQLAYAGKPGSEVSLYVDKVCFPKGISLMNLECSNLSKEAWDESFELQLKCFETKAFDLHVWDLLQLKYQCFSNILQLKFNNLGGKKCTSFSLGFLILSS